MVLTIHWQNVVDIRPRLYVRMMVALPIVRIVAPVDAAVATTAMNSFIRYT